MQFARLLTVNRNEFTINFWGVVSISIKRGNGDEPEIRQNEEGRQHAESDTVNAK